MFLFNDKKSYQRIEDLKERIETLEYKLKQREAEIQKLTQEQADAVKSDEVNCTPFWYTSTKPTV
jgi:prefoldin subunit 5